MYFKLIKTHTLNIITKVTHILSTYSIYTGQFSQYIYRLYCTVPPLITIDGVLHIYTTYLNSDVCPKNRLVIHLTSCVLIHATFIHNSWRIKTIQLNNVAEKWFFSSFGKCVS